MRTYKTYQLARRFQHHSQDASTFFNQSLSLPTSIRHIQSSSQNLQNIFDNSQQLRIRKLQMDEDKGFNVLRHSQLEMQNRIKQKKRRGFRSNQNQLCSFCSYSSSNLRKLSKDYLTKEEVLRQNSPPSLKVKINQIQQKNMLNSSLSNLHLNSQDTWTSSVAKTDTSMNMSNEKFSLFKLKERMIKYKQSWGKYNQNDLKTKNSHLLKIGRISTKFNDKKLTKFQKKIFLNQSYDKTIGSWKQTLRSNKQQEMNQIKKCQVIEKNGISLSGNNKLRKQKQWLENKHTNGFYFFRNKHKFY